MNLADALKRVTEYERLDLQDAVVLFSDDGIRRLWEKGTADEMLRFLSFLWRKQCVAVASCLCARSVEHMVSPTSAGIVEHALDMTERWSRGECSEHERAEAGFRVEEHRRRLSAKEKLSIRESWALLSVFCAAKQHMMEVHIANASSYAALALSHSRTDETAWYEIEQFRLASRIRQAISAPTGDEVRGAFDHWWRRWGT